MNETLVNHEARVLMDHGPFLILEGQGPVQGVTVYEFPTKDAARNWHDSVADRKVRQHRKKGAKYLVILTEGGAPELPAQQCRSPALTISIAQCEAHRDQRDQRWPLSPKRRPAFAKSDSSYSWAPDSPRGDIMAFA